MPTTTASWSCQQEQGRRQGRRRCSTRSGGARLTIAVAIAIAIAIALKFAHPPFPFLSPVLGLGMGIGNASHHPSRFLLSRPFPRRPCNPIRRRTAHGVGGVGDDVKVALFVTPRRFSEEEEDKDDDDDDDDDAMALVQVSPSNPPVPMPALSRRTFLPMGVSSLLASLQALSVASSAAASSSSSSSSSSSVTLSLSSLSDGGGTNAGTYAPAGVLLRPPPMAGGTAAVVPGLAARLRPVVVDDGSGWDPSFSSLSSSSSALVPVTELGKSRLLASDLAPLNPSISPLAEKDVYYPPFLLGSWDVTATLRRKIYPYGIEYVPSKSLLDGSPRYRYESVGDSALYVARYMYADDYDNTEKLRKKGTIRKIIADRSGNAMSISRAYRQLTPVQEVTWDPKADPTRLTLSFGAGPLAEDMMPLGQRRAEVYITARRMDAGDTNKNKNNNNTKHNDDDDDDSDNGIFCAAERTRLVYLSPGNVLVSDTETITEFHLVEKDDKNGSDNGNYDRSRGEEISKDKGHRRVKAFQRVAVYLTPNPNSREGILWEAVRGRAVAFFDYELEMKERLG